MAIIVVFDTNILFSAAGWRGKPFQWVEQARDGNVQAVTCVELMEELAEKLESKLGFSRTDYRNACRLFEFSSRGKHSEDVEGLAA